MEVLQKGRFNPAADQVLLVNLVKSVPVDWSQAVADFLQLRGLNLVLSPKHLSLARQGHGVVVMRHSRALNSCPLAQEQEKGNEEPCGLTTSLCVSRVLVLFPQHSFDMPALVHYSVYCPSNVGSIHGLKAHWKFFMKLWLTPLIPRQMFFHEYFSMDPFMKRYYYFRNLFI